MHWPPQTDGNPLLELAHAALDSVNGDRVTRGALQGRAGDCAVVALGKAAGAMAAGAAAALGGRITHGFRCAPRGYDWPGTPAWEAYEGGHPLPDESSLTAGQALATWLEALPPGLPLLVLMSGGSSACIELPADGVTLERLREDTAGWIAAGLGIGELNRHRAELSALKAGGALEFCGDRPVEVFVVSDVPGDDAALVGSGPFVVSRRKGAAPTSNPPVGAVPSHRDKSTVGAVPSHRDPTILATNRMALYAIVDKAAALGLPVNEINTLEGDAVEQGEAIAARLLDAEPGLYLWGGETTVRLPDHPGRGGRCQALALAAARTFAGHDGIRLLALATDGVDGNGDDAGARVDGHTVEWIATEGLDADDALARADSGTALEAAGALVHTGPTGTNVMDLVLAHVQ